MPDGKAANGEDDWCKLDFYDYDLGGSGPVFRDEPFVENGVSEDILFGGGKDGILRIFDITDPRQASIPEKDTICVRTPCLPDDGRQEQDAHIMAGPIYWPAKGLVYLSRENFPVRAFASPAPVQFGNVIYSVADSETTRTIVGHPGAILFLSANEANGILWYACAPNNSPEFGSGAAQHTLRGRLVAVDATNLATELWNSDNKESDDIGYFAKFNPPLFTHGRVYVASFPPEDGNTGFIHVFGPNPPQKPPVYYLSDGSSR